MTATPDVPASPPVHSGQPFVIAIVGPTAVGKTEVAEQVAVRLGGQIVSADSMQVYRGMDIGTSKPAPAERRVPYHCVDVAEPGEAYSAARFQACARAAFATIASEGEVPVLCGGTGLYVRAALDDWEFPAGDQIDNPIREQYELFEREYGPEALHELLSARDPASAALIHPNNVRRVIRALEMLEDGASYAEQHAGFSARQSLYPCTMVGLTMDRGELYRRIDRRVDQMIERGLLAEVKRLLRAGLRDALTAAQAIGYKELVPVAESGASLETAVDAIKQASRRYAKRQLTWFGRDARIRWIDVTGMDVAAATDATTGALDWANLSDESMSDTEGE